MPRGVHKYDVHEQKEKAKRSSKEKCHIVTLTHIQKQGRFAAKKPQNRTNDSEENRTDSYVIYTDSFVSCEVLLICEESPLRSAPPWLIMYLGKRKRGESCAEREERFTPKWMRCS